MEMERPMGGSSEGPSRIRERHMVGSLAGPSHSMSPLISRSTNLELLDNSGGRRGGTEPEPKFWSEPQGKSKPPGNGEPKILHIESKLIYVEPEPEFWSESQIEPEPQLWPEPQIEPEPEQSQDGNLFLKGPGRAGMRNAGMGNAGMANAGMADAGMANAGMGSAGIGEHKPPQIEPEPEPIP